VSARSKARKRALDVLFEADSKGVPIAAILAEHIRRRRSDGSPDLNEYTVTVVEGVSANLSEIDKRIEKSATGWSLDRMPDVDRAIARVAVYEILFAPDVPDAVAISEAADLAADLSTAESPRFIAGLLHAVANQPPSAI
jgi:N utilization substance protein B